MDYNNELNDKQYLAVTSQSQHLRIIAGAGSGKTRVLTYRIAYLIDQFHVEPWKILAITFTNKVANEMKQRVMGLLPKANKDLTIRTFHSFAANFLRREISVLGYPSTFTILDEEDQTKLIKDIASERGYKRNDQIVKKSLSYISKQKLLEKTPDEIVIIKPSFEDEFECLEFYKRYEEEKDKMYSLDFDDLLLKTNYILEHYLDIRMKWQDRIDHILIDEFQDTNDTEYKLVNLLKKSSTHLYVVGDPDQTIYTWRGANQKIILDIEKKFSNMETIILNQNYRSTETILKSANKLIANNKLRVEKDLFTKQNKGEKIIVKGYSTSKDEANYIAREIKKLKDVDHYNYKDIVLLYRSSYVTVDFETALTQYGIPYKVYGGTKFYARKEIKDVLAYFHLIVNPKDDISLMRIINTPRRGIGDVILAAIRNNALINNQSIYEYLCDLDPDSKDISPRAMKSLKSMIMTIELAKNEIAKGEEMYSKILEDMIYSLGYYDYLKEDDEGDDRRDHVKTLFDDIRHFIKNNPESSFDEYLQNITLMSAQDEVIDDDHVKLMTVHVAKGLEFAVVFVIRFSQGVFPNGRSLLEGGFKAVEEERRLAYVALTRAKERLYLTYTQGYFYVLSANLTASQFIKESGNDSATDSIDNSLRAYSSNRKPVEDKPLFDDIPRPTIPNLSNNKPNDISWEKGDIVISSKLGRGKVLSVDGDNIIEVMFDDHGIKTMLGSHPTLSKGEFDA